uniref:Nuclear receptor domain-containing protein n=1 Tax=Acrobeloides nanus TaxID=290746 RepID=A0A914DDK1_9BILA
MDECVICGNESDGRHFGAQVCRACSAFFRRSVSEGLVYKCRGSNNCVLKYDYRNVCRACRLSACINSGMKVELVHKRSQALGVQRRSIGSQESYSPENKNLVLKQELSPMQPSTTSTQEMEIVNQNSILNKLLQGVNVFLNAQKTLYIVEHPNQSVTNLEFEMDRKSEWNRIERYCVYVINSMLTEHFEPYNLMQQKEKRLIIKNTSTKISFLIRCYLTSKHFPDPEDIRCVTHYGYYNTPESNEYFFANEVSQNQEECFKMHNYFLEEIRSIANKLVKYEFREVDLAALSYMIFAQECEKVALYTDIIETNKTILFEEYHKNIVSAYGFDKAGVKFANVLNLQNDITELQRLIYEFRIMGKVFTNDFVDIWDELLFENQDPQQPRPTANSVSSEHYAESEC